MRTWYPVSIAITTQLVPGSYASAILWRLRYRTLQSSSKGQHGVSLWIRTRSPVYPLRLHHKWCQGANFTTETRTDTVFEPDESQGSSITREMGWDGGQDGTTVAWIVMWEGPSDWHPFHVDDINNSIVDDDGAVDGVMDRIIDGFCWWPGRGLC